MIDLKGKVVLVTGASRGIGAARVRAVAEAGAEVILHDGRSAERAEELAVAVGRERCHLVQADFEKRTWQMFWRMVVDNLSAAHVAAEFGVTIHAVYKARSRVLAKLREQFGDLFE